MVADRTDERLFSPIKRQLASFAKEVQAMLRARAELLGLELQAARAVGTRLAIALVVGSLSALVAAPVGLVALSSQMARWFDLDALGILWFFTAALLIAGGGLIVGGWRRYRREFSGLEDSIAELREDIVWMREWFETEATDDEADPASEDSGSEATSETAAVAEDNDQVD